MTILLKLTPKHASIVHNPEAVNKIYGSVNVSNSTIERLQNYTPKWSPTNWFRLHLDPGDKTIFITDALRNFTYHRNNSNVFIKLRYFDRLQ